MKRIRLYIFFLYIKNWNFSPIRSDPDHDPLFHETDPGIRIRIQIDMKWICNKEGGCSVFLIVVS